MDSVYLLYRCCELRLARPELRLRAVHVHHGLLPEADAWLGHCQQLCARLAVPLEVLRLALVPRPGESVEAAAREARYQALRRLIGPGEVLLTAHHQDDQLETVLLQLFRGAGVAGLAAMPAVASFGAGWHQRPLLGMDRAQIVAAARAAGLDWVEDPSNTAGRFGRGYLRSALLPPLRSRWPAVAAAVARSARHLAEAQSLLDDIAALDAVTARDGARLRVAAVAGLARPRQANLLRWWLRERGIGVPSTARLNAILDDLVPARADARPLVCWRHGEVRRFRGRLYALRPLPDHRLAVGPVAGAVLAVSLGDGCGRFRLVPGDQGGIAASPAGQLEIRLRAGGERLRLVADRPRRALKDLCREAGVVPWMRHRLPLVYVRGNLAAVADLWVDAGFRAAPGAPALQPVWDERPELF